MALDSDDALMAYMHAARWRFDPATNGWRKGREWVSHKQVCEAFTAASEGLPYTPTGTSETVNGITARAANLDVANEP